MLDIGNFLKKLNYNHTETYKINESIMVYILLLTTVYT